MSEYLVNCKTKPGMYAQYEFDVRVFAEDEEAAITKAYQKLRNDAFRGYSFDMWRFTII